MHLRDCQLAGVDKHYWKDATRTSGKGKKKDRTKRYVNREKRTHRPIWTILCGRNIHSNKGNKSKCFILKEPNSLSHWNKENEAFVHKYTSKGKKARASGLPATRAQRWCFISIWKKARRISRLLVSQDNNILPQGLSSQFYFVHNSLVFQKATLAKGLGEKLTTCQKSMSRFPLDKEMDYTSWKFPVVSSGSPVIYFANWRERTTELWDWKLSRQHLNYDEIIAYR